jgi:serine/threonine protein phosphatase PrpC
MIQLTTACVSSVDETRGNTSNLLFSGQILPERNAGLNGAPSLKLEPGAACVAAVFDGNGATAREAAYLAASAFRSASDKLRSLDDLEALYAKIAGDIAVPSTKDATLATSAVAACVDGDKLALACLGSCRAYLLRGRNLYLLSRESAAAAPEDAPPAPGEGAALGKTDVKPFTVKGTMLPDDQLLLCTGWLCAALDTREILRVLYEGETPSAALQLLARRAGSGRGDIAAVLLRAEGAAEPEVPAEDVEAAEEE